MKTITTPNYENICLDETFARKARVFSLVGDETRIRILCFMFRYKKGCVSDIAKSLDMSVSSISHHLQIMKDNGFFITERMKNNICYLLKESPFMKGLKKIICDLDLERSDL